MAKLGEADYYDAAFFAGLHGGRGVTAEDVIEGRVVEAPRRVVTPKDVLSKAAEDELPKLYAARAAHLQKLKFGFGEADTAKWKADNPTPAGEVAPSDDEIQERLKSELLAAGMALSRDIVAAEVKAEIEAQAKVDAEAAAARRASLSPDQAQALRDAVTQADAEVARIAARSERFEDLHCGDADGKVQGRREEIASAHGIASERSFAARREAAHFGLSA